MMLKVMSVVLIASACSLNDPFNPTENRQGDILLPKPPVSEPYRKKLFKPPLKKVAQNEWPEIWDDLNFKDLDVAIERQLKKFRRFTFESTFKIGSERFPSQVVPLGLVAIREILKDLNSRNLSKVEFKEALKQELLDNFNLYTPKDLEQNQGAFFTGYYTPTMNASLDRTEAFPWGIYKRPENEKLAKSTRKQIDFQDKLVESGYDIFYTDDLFKLYLTHVEGGGRVSYLNSDGQRSFKYLNYNNTNKRTFRFISKYMIEKGYIDDLSIKSQRRYLDANPQRWEEIYSYSPGYIYFSATDEPPHGNDGVSLTNARAIATDRKLYKYKGILAFIQGQRPDRYNEDNQIITEEFSRFVIDHDTGGAIKGSSRADIFWGEDDKAEFAAFYTQNRGYLSYLFLKQERIERWMPLFR
ncbi:MAG: MltA domain-containing protein [Bdellovibrionales bacterium]